MPTPYPYVAIGIPVVVFLLGYEWLNVAVALILSVGVFISAGWVDYRRHGANDLSPSVRASRDRAKHKWPAEERLEGLRHAPGVYTATAPDRGHVLVVVPDGDGPWIYATVPSLSRRATTDVVEFSSYDALVEHLGKEGIGYVPPSSYARVLTQSLTVRLYKNGVTSESIASGLSGARRVSALNLTGPITTSGPRFAEFDRRIPTRAEADQIIEEGLGLALRRVPRQHRDLEFLHLFPGLRALWIHGPVNPAGIGSLTTLTQLSLISTGSDEVDLSALRGLTYYEGELGGRESVLALPALRELYLGGLDKGRLSRIPATLEHLSLHDATSLENLDRVGIARGLRTLEVQGPRQLDVAAVATLEHLRQLTLIEISRLTGTSALRSARRLRELRLDHVESVDDSEVFGSLRGVDIVVTGREPHAAEQ